MRRKKLFNNIQLQPNE